MKTKPEIPKALKFIFLTVLFLIISNHYALSEIVKTDDVKNPISIEYKDKKIDAQIKGLLQFDYKNFFEEQRADDKFDIRRARLGFDAKFNEWLLFGLEFEFQGNDAKNLLEAFCELKFNNNGLKLGQFKEPFSLEWQSPEKSTFFAERSIGYYLTPMRDIGIMVSGDFLNQCINYSAGLFNGDGVDGSPGGSRNDEPEIAARIVLSPLRTSEIDFIKSFQIGGSATYAHIDLSNVDLEVKSSPMAGSNRNIFILNQNTKFGVLQDVEDRWRIGTEAAWTFGSFLLQGEYMFLTYTNLKPVSNPVSDANFSAGYISAIFFLTGEQPVLANGIIKPVKPANSFDPSKGDFGALAFAARLDRFSGDSNWIQKGAFVSVEDAKAFSFAADWILFPYCRLIFDYTYTHLSDPLTGRVNPDGSIDYIDKENAVTIRLDIDI